MKSTMLISHLLAHRDGERLDPEIAAHIDADAGARGQLDVLRRIKHELNDLPPVEPDESAWTEIVRARDSHRVWTLRYPVATAAGVFLAAVLAIVAWNPLREIADPGVSRGDPAQVVLATGALQNLVSRSQFLEARMPARGMPAGRFTGNSSQQALL